MARSKVRGSELNKKINTNHPPGSPDYMELQRLIFSLNDIAHRFGYAEMARVATLIDNESLYLAIQENLKEK